MDKTLNGLNERLQAIYLQENGIGIPPDSYTDNAAHTPPTGTHWGKLTVTKAITFSDVKISGTTSGALSGIALPAGFTCRANFTSVTGDGTGAYIMSYTAALT